MPLADAMACAAQAASKTWGSETWGLIVPGPACQALGETMTAQNPKRVALITGVTGQDGAYLAEYLLGLGTLRSRPGSAAERDHAVLPALALWCRKAVRLLDHGKLPGGLWHVCLERHPVQPRKPDPRRNLRDPQDHAQRRPHRNRPGR